MRMWGQEKSERRYEKPWRHKQVQNKLCDRSWSESICKWNKPFEVVADKAQFLPNVPHTSVKPVVMAHRCRFEQYTLSASAVARRQWNEISMKTQGGEWIIILKLRHKWMAFLILEWTSWAKYGIWNVVVKYWLPLVWHSVIRGLGYPRLT